jgi:hypothetical protein
VAHLVKLGPQERLGTVYDSRRSPNNVQKMFGDAYGHRKLIEDIGKCVATKRAGKKGGDTESLVRTVNAVDKYEELVKRFVVRCFEGCGVVLDDRSYAAVDKVRKVSADNRRFAAKSKAQTFKTSVLAKAKTLLKQK